MEKSILLLVFFYQINIVLYSNEFVFNKIAFYMAVISEYFSIINALSIIIEEIKWRIKLFQHDEVN